MGNKNRHSKDKLYIVPKEYASEWGGYKAKSKGLPFRSLPFYCCGLSMLPFGDSPVATRDGIVFEAENIIPYVKEKGRNPVTGQPMKLKELIPVKFHKNAEGKYHCPVTYKVFTDYTHIVANGKSGHVYSYNAIENLCKKTKRWKDLLTDEPFLPEDLITIQDPKYVSQREIESFAFVRDGENPGTAVQILQGVKTRSDDKQEGSGEAAEQEKEGEQSEGLSDRKRKELEDEALRPRILKTELMERVLQESETSSQIVDKHKELFKVETEDPNAPLSDKFTTETHSAAVTSTLYAAHAQGGTHYRRMTDTEQRDELYRKAKDYGKKGYVRVVTDHGPLNLELHCDLCPETCHNFLLHCESGYYKNTVFHRLVPSFMIQGGDPKGDGTGGHSAFKDVREFKDEIRAKLSHKGPGVLSMANSGPNTNRSQFFITFATATHLDGRHTVFGRLVGGMDTLRALEKVERKSQDKPKKPPVIQDIVVFSNPFDEVQKLVEKDRLMRGAIQGAPKSSATDSEMAKPVSKRHKASSFLNLDQCC